LPLLKFQPSYIFPFVTAVWCNAEAGEEQMNSEHYSHTLYAASTLLKPHLIMK